MSIWMQGKLELLELSDSAFGSKFVTGQNVTCANFLFVCKMCFTKTNIYLTMNSELCLNCFLSSGVGLVSGYLCQWICGPGFPSVRME